MVQQDQTEAGDLDDPATTIALLQARRGRRRQGLLGQRRQAAIGRHHLRHLPFDGGRRLRPGIGQRLDGWPNRDLDVGKIITLAPNLKPLTDRLGIGEDELKKALLAWGPGKYDAELLHDGKAFRPDGKTAATLLPAAFGLAGVNNHTYTGWGSVTHWNAYVANTQMRGKGTFFDPRLERRGEVPRRRQNQGLEHPQRPRPGHGEAAGAALLSAVDRRRPSRRKAASTSAAAARGQALFNGKADCNRCHVPPLFTEPGWPMHTAEEIGIDDFQAKRSPDERYRTTPLRGLWAHAKGGFYHDGRFATLPDVIDHYNAHFKLGLTENEINDLAEYLKSL